MAALVLSEMREYVQIPAAKVEVEQHAAAKIGGSIAAGILIGAAAAFLVGGLVGMHETTTSVVTVGHSVTSP